MTAGYQRPKQTVSIKTAMAMFLKLEESWTNQGVHIVSYALGHDRNVDCNV